MSEQIDLALGVLDRQLIDSAEWRCGKVDDLELEGVREGEPAVTAILCGAPAWRGRGWVGRLAARVARGRLVRIPWDEVDEVGSSVRLKKSAAELGLGRGEDSTRRWVEWIPGAR
jgi:hypothetical protein